MRPHYNLLVWQKAIDLVATVYEITRDFPKEELYGLTSQIRRSAVSVPSNIAEGAARSTKKELIQFLMIARGSLSELETQLLIGVRLDYLDQNHLVFKQIEDVANLLGGLIRSTNR